MAKKSKKINTSGEGGFVFSTNEDFDFSSHESDHTLENDKQELTVHLEKKGRGGKTAVVIKGFIGKESDLANLGRALKQHCGVGGSVKDGEIIIQGNPRDKIMDYLKNNGFKAKRVGG